MRPVEYWIAAVLSATLVAASWRGWLPYDMTETLGFVTGAVCVYMVVRQDILNFPVGIANNVFFLVLFGRARLYGDASLQIVYVALGVHGWYEWLHGGENRTALVVTRATSRGIVVLAAIAIAGTLGLSVVLRANDDSSPLLDALTTVLSLVAQYMLNRKLLENWVVWIAADVIYVYLYFVRDLRLTAVLYFVFLCMCVAGFASWRRSVARPEALDA